MKTQSRLNNQIDSTKVNQVNEFKYPDSSFTENLSLNRKILLYECPSISGNLFLILSNAHVRMRLPILGDSFRSAVSSHNKMTRRMQPAASLIIYYVLMSKLSTKLGSLNQDRMLDTNVRLALIFIVGEGWRPGGYDMNNL